MQKMVISERWCGGELEKHPTENALSSRNDETRMVAGGKCSVVVEVRTLKPEAVFKQNRIDDEYASTLPKTYTILSK